MSYMCGAGAAGGTGAKDTIAAAEGRAACPVAGRGAAAATTAGSVAGGGAAAAGGEEGLTQGLKEELCPARVFAMAGLGVGEEELRRMVFSRKNFFKKWFEKK